MFLRMPRVFWANFEDRCTREIVVSWTVSAGLKMEGASFGGSFTLCSGFCVLPSGSSGELDSKTYSEGAGFLITEFRR